MGNPIRGLLVLLLPLLADGGDASADLLGAHGGIAPSIAQQAINAADLATKAADLATANALVARNLVGLAGQTVQRTSQAVNNNIPGNVPIGMPNVGVSNTNLYSSENHTEPVLLEEYPHVWHQLPQRAIGYKHRRGSASYSTSRNTFMQMLMICTMENGNAESQSPEEKGMQLLPMPTMGTILFPMQVENR